MGHTYYVSVRGVNNAFLTSEALTSSGVTVVSETPTIALAKSYADGTAVSLASKTVTAAFAGKFYIQDESRASGIRVVSSASVVANQSVQVAGKLALVDGERCLVDCVVVPGASGAGPRPLILRQSTIGGAAFNGHTPGITGSVDLNNVGLLIRNSGRVTAVMADGFYMDDGSALGDGSGSSGIWVWTGSAPAHAAGAWVQVTGVSSVKQVGANAAPAILARFVIGL